MTAEEIRKAMDKSNASINACYPDIDMAIRGATNAILHEIAAQLAELNAQLSKVIAADGTGHVVNVAPSDVTVHY